MTKFYIGLSNNKAVKVKSIYKEVDGTVYKLDTEDEKDVDTEDNGITKVIEDYFASKEKDTNDE